MKSARKLLLAFLLLSVSDIPLLCRGNLQEEHHQFEASKECPEHAHLPPADHIGHNQVVAVPTEGSPWPLPQSIQTGPDTYFLSDNVFRYVALYDCM